MNERAGGKTADDDEKKARGRGVKKCIYKKGNEKKRNEKTPSQKVKMKRRSGKREHVCFAVWRNI